MNEQKALDYQIVLNQAQGSNLRDGCLFIGVAVAILIWGLDGTNMEVFCNNFQMPKYHLFQFWEEFKTKETKYQKYILLSYIDGS